MADAKSKVFVVKPKKEDASVPAVKRLVRASRRSEVESFLLNEFSIDIASQAECFDLATAGVKLEDANGE